MQVHCLCKSLQRLVREPPFAGSTLLAHLAWSCNLKEDRVSHGDLQNPPCVGGFIRTLGMNEGSGQADSDLGVNDPPMGDVPPRQWDWLLLSNFNLITMASHFPSVC